MKLSHLLFLITVHITFSYTAQCQNPTTKYVLGKFYIDTAQAQNQYYTIETSENSTTIKERGVFLSNPDIIAKASLTVTNGSYDSVEINFDNGTIKSDIKVFRTSEGTYHSYKNGTLVDSILSDASLILFDGPNPSFDITNASICQSKKTKTYVVLINWVTGTLSMEKQIIKKKKNSVRIIKKSTKRETRFSSTNTGIGAEKYTQNKESYSFKTISEKTAFHE